MAYSIENKQKHLCNEELSLHVLDIIRSIMKASETGKNEVISTSCGKPESLSQKQIKFTWLVL